MSRGLSMSTGCLGCQSDSAHAIDLCKSYQNENINTYNGACATVYESRAFSSLSGVINVATSTFRCLYVVSRGCSSDSSSQNPGAMHDA